MKLLRITPFIFSGAGAIASLCPHSFLLEEVGTLTGYSTSPAVSWLIRFVGFILMGIGNLEWYRIFTLDNCIGTGLTITMKRIVYLVTGLGILTESDLCKVIQTYREIQILHTILLPLGRTILSILLFTSFAVIVCFNYVTFRMFYKMPGMAYVIARESKTGPVCENRFSVFTVFY